MQEQSRKLHLASPREHLAEAGNVQEARRIIKDMRTGLKLDPKTLAISLRESVDAHQPIHLVYPGELVGDGTELR
jgi:hypothetical protein